MTMDSQFLTPKEVAEILGVHQKTVHHWLRMKKYNATLLYVGEPEQQKYTVNLPATGLELVYSDQGTEIYRLAG